MTCRFSLSLCGIGLLLVGCSLVPESAPPTLDLAARWRDGAALPLAQSVAVQSGWWASFGDATLSRLEEQALRDSPTLAQAQARIEQARGSAEAAGAALYPTLTLNGAASRARGGGATSAGGRQSLFAQAGFELDFWGKNGAMRDSALALERASGLDADTVGLTLTASVADTYFQLLSARQRLALARTISTDADRLLALVRVQLRAGVASELQLEQQKNTAATFAAAVPALQQQVEQNAHLLAQLVGATPERFTLPTGDSGTLPVLQPWAGIPSEILRRRPDIRAAEARLASANFDVGVARAAFYPSITLTADAGLSSASLGRLLSGNPVADIAAALAQPVFDGGRLNGQLRYDRARVTELASAYRATVLTALQEVEDMLSAAQRQRELEDADTIAAVSARRAGALARTQYRLGVADFISVLDTERIAYQAEDALLQVRLARLQAAVGLFRTLGGGFTDDDSGSAPMSTGVSQ